MRAHRVPGFSRLSIQFTVHLLKFRSSLSVDQIVDTLLNRVHFGLASGFCDSVLLSTLPVNQIAETLSAYAANRLAVGFVVREVGVAVHLDTNRSVRSVVFF